MPVYTWLAAGIVLLVAVVAYANSLSNGLVWDDPIILSRQLVVFHSVTDVLFPPHGIPQYSPDYYRPLTIATLLLDWKIGGGNPFPFHLSVVLLHVLASVLVSLFALQVFDQSLGGFVAATAAGALFAAHPAHTESVAWIAGRSDVLATCGVIAAVMAHHGLRPSWGASALTGLFVLAALAAKENAIVVLPLLALADLTLRHESPSRELLVRRFAGPVLATVLYLLLRRAALGDFLGNAAGAASLQRPLTDVVAAVGAYGLKLLWPRYLNAYIDAVPQGVTAITVAALVALAAAAWWLWQRKQNLPVFCLLWIVLTLAPSLSIVWKIPEAPMAERYLYLPSTGFCLLVGCGLLTAWNRWPYVAAHRALIALATLVVAGATLSTIQRNAVWHDDLTLWTDTAAKARVSGMPLRSLATAYQQRGQTEQARTYFTRALDLRNNQNGLQTIYNNLGTLAMQAGEFDEARKNYQQALTANPQAPDTLFNLGLAIFQSGGGTPTAARDALIPLLEAAELSPHDADIQAGLGQVYATMGDTQIAVTYLRRALELVPSPATAENIRSYLRTLEEKRRATDG